jgi:hypothetical protein
MPILARREETVTIMILHEITESDPEYEQVSAHSQAFAKAMDATWLSTRESDFATLVREYKRLEAEHLARIADYEFHAREIKRRIAEIVLQAAIDRQQPFETCTQLWNDLLRLGFSDIDRTCTMTWYYAECCRRNKQTEIGIQLLEPLIDELQGLLAEPNFDEGVAEYYQEQLEIMGKLLAKLQAQRP